MSSSPHQRPSRCPDCDVPAGQCHLDGCDVARCMTTGLQRLGHGPCDCAPDIWTGTWPGKAECNEFGWTYGPGLPYLNRLHTQAVWSPEKKRWIRIVAERIDSAPLSTGKDRK